MKRKNLNAMAIFLLCAFLPACQENNENNACGNGQIDLGEACDIGLKTPISCSSFDNTKQWISGSAACSIDCKHITQGTCMVSGNTCGNGQLDAMEACDTNLGMTRTCNDLNPTKQWQPGGLPGCASDCMSLTQGSCVEIIAQQNCGNGILDNGELCDTAIAIPCETLDANKNWVSGNAACLNCQEIMQGSCVENTTPSQESCGNGLLDAGEMCDTKLASQKTCSDFDPSKSWQSDGKPGCSDDCKSLTQGTCAENAVNPQKCGNGTVDPGEACDPKSSKVLTCNDFNSNTIWESGTPQCSSDCKQIMPGTCKAFESEYTDPNILPTDEVTQERCNLEKDEYVEKCEGQVAHFCSEDGYVVKRDCSKITTAENVLSCQVARETKEHGSFADCVSKCEGNTTSYNTCLGNYVATHQCEAVQNSSEKYEFIYTDEPCEVACNDGHCTSDLGPKVGASCGPDYQGECYQGKAYTCANGTIEERACETGKTCAMLFGGKAPECVEKCSASDVSSSEYKCVTEGSKVKTQNHVCLVANDSKYYWFNQSETCQATCDQGVCDLVIPTTGATCMPGNQNDICAHNNLYFCNTTTNKIDVMTCGAGDFLLQPFCRSLNVEYSDCVVPCEEGTEPIMNCGGSNAKHTAYEDNYICEPGLDGQYYYFNHQKECETTCKSGVCQ